MLDGLVAGRVAERLFESAVANWRPGETMVLMELSELQKLPWEDFDLLLSAAGDIWQYVAPVAQQDRADAARYYAARRAVVCPMVVDHMTSIMTVALHLEACGPLTGAEMAT